MVKLGRMIHETLKAAQGESRVGELAGLSTRVKEGFKQRLGGVDIFGTDKEWSGGLLRIVADERGIAVAFHLGGTLRWAGSEGDRVCYDIADGDARSFKFVRHDENNPAEKRDFFGAGFPYQEDCMKLSRVTGGTVARVKVGVQHAFCTDVVCRVTAYSIEDVRFYASGQQLIDAVRTVFEEAISGIDGEWDRIFRLLST